MTTSHPQVDEYFQNLKLWKDELSLLRRILLTTPLTEDFKWRSPCYTHGKGNILILASLRDCCTVGFFKGALLKDPEGVLTRSGENSRSARVIRFTSLCEISELEPTLRAYIEEAIENEEAGRKIDFSDDREMDYPAEFEEELDQQPALRTAFDALTPGRQRAYLIFFSGAKQSSTRKARVQKYVSRILDGKGINDCTCGLSQRLPQCDGSHNAIR
ncbi:MAG: hypothetical protein CMJ46_11695 [Planctomyces sp.]|nr:hypothetical protein [Planctomyces sp.]